VTVLLVSELLCEALAVSPHCKERVDETLTNSLLANIPRQGLPLLSLGRSLPWLAYTFLGKI
jgi:hypothetical protein